jgi:hypothetical protein
MPTVTRRGRVSASPQTRTKTDSDSSHLDFMAAFVAVKNSPQQLRPVFVEGADKRCDYAKFVAGVVAGAGLLENDTSSSFQSVSFETGSRARTPARTWLRAHAADAAACGMGRTNHAGLRPLPLRRHHLDGDRAMEQREAGVGIGQHLRSACTLQHLQHGLRDRLAAAELRAAKLATRRLHSLSPGGRGRLKRRFDSIIAAPTPSRRFAFPPANGNEDRRQREDVGRERRH